VVHAARTHVAASPRDRAVDASGTAALVEEVARLRAALAESEADRDCALDQISKGFAESMLTADDRDAARAEAKRFAAERDQAARDRDTWQRRAYEALDARAE